MQPICVWGNPKTPGLGFFLKKTVFFEPWCNECLSLFYLVAQRAMWHACTGGIAQSDVRSRPLSDVTTFQHIHLWRSQSVFISESACLCFTVATPPEKSWNFYQKISRTWKVRKMTLVVENPGNLLVRSWKVVEFARQMQTAVFGFKQTCYCRRK